MQCYYNLLDFRKRVNELYEEIKILKIFVDVTIEDIPQTITEKLYDISDVIDDCLEKHKNLKIYVLSSNNIKTRRKIADFNDIKMKLEEIITLLYFLRLVIKKNYKEISYHEISVMLEITLKKSEEIINLANKTKLKIYPNEKTKLKSSAKDLDLSKSQMLPKNIIKLQT